MARRKYVVLAVGYYTTSVAEGPFRSEQKAMSRAVAVSREVATYDPVSVMVAEMRKPVKGRK